VSGDNCLTWQDRAHRPLYFDTEFLADDPAVIGASWYYATLIEIPILQALIRMGMNQGPALSAAGHPPQTFQGSLKLFRR